MESRLCITFSERSNAMANAQNQYQGCKTVAFQTDQAT